MVGISFVELLARNGEYFAEKTALIEGDRCLTYRQLFEHVGKLGGLLKGYGVSPETIVGVHVERSIESVIAFLAVLESGGAYLPLNVELPASRLQFMLDDVAPPLILMRGTQVLSFPDCEARTVDIDAVLNETGDDSRPALFGGVVGHPINSLAYVIYTSGSTGVPKGVMVEHQALQNYLSWRVRNFHLGPNDVCVHKAPLSFDMSIAEILVPLLSGAMLVIIRQRKYFDMEHLLYCIEKHQVTRLSLVPSMLSVLLTYWHRCKSVKEVFSGGETLTINLASQFRRVAGTTCSLHNIYGPTETALAVSCHTFDTNSDLERVAIGVPVDNVDFSMINEDRKPCEKSGELLIGGACLARGYVNDQKLTREKFIICQDKSGSPVRYYRTGDRVKKRGNGIFEYLGRTDNQVKINGCRLELGEIEAVLDQHPGIVRSSLLLLKSNVAGLDRLVAFVEINSDVNVDIALSVSAMHEFLAPHLPVYAHPSRVIFLDQLPLGRHGKIDRDKLQALLTD